MAESMAKKKYSFVVKAGENGSYKMFYSDGPAVNRCIGHLLQSKRKDFCPSAKVSLIKAGAGNQHRIDALSRGKAASYSLLRAL